MDWENIIEEIKALEPKIDSFLDGLEMAKLISIEFKFSHQFLLLLSPDHAQALQKA